MGCAAGRAVAGLTRLPVWVFFEREFFAQGQQEFRIDVRHPDAVEVFLQQVPFDLVLLALAFGHLAHLAGVGDEGFGQARERAAVQVLALAHAVAQVEEPVGGDLRRGVDGQLAGRVDDALALKVSAGVDLGTAVAALKSELAVVESCEGFGGLLAGGFGCHILGFQYAGCPELLSSVVKFMASQIPTCGSGGTADALASGASWSNPVGVRIPPSAPAPKSRRCSPGCTVLCG